MLQLNGRYGENDHKKDCITNLHERMLPDVRIEPETDHIPDECATDRTTAPGHFMQISDILESVLRPYKVVVQ